MTKLNKNVFTVCYDVEGSKRIYSSKNFFQLTESDVKLTGAINSIEQNLAWVLENFSVSPSGFYFYYDIKANSIKHLIESVSVDLQTDKLNESVESYDQIYELNERLNNLEILRKQHKLSNNQVAVNEANTIISDIQNKIQELKKSAVYVKYSYVAEDNKVYINNREVAVDGFAEQAFASGHINYGNKPILNAFEIAAKNFNKFAIVSNLIESNTGSILMSTFRLKNRAYIYKLNEATSISQFNEYSPIMAIEYVAENTGHDISFMFDDVLELNVTLQNKIQQRLDEAYELLSFLKSQKELFTDSNRNIVEIKEAEKIINSEIVKFKQIIQILEDDNLTKNDGYLDAKIMTAYQDIPEGSEVKVDALDYTTAGKDDMVTIIVNEKPIKVIKKHIELEAADTI
jgi:hypothetical protein